jgi:hypothetical protein
VSAASARDWAEAVLRLAMLLSIQGWTFEQPCSRYSTAWRRHSTGLAMSAAFAELLTQGAAP